ncbi:MAG: ABC transporter permease [Candidatus Moduliflexus flocculans]|nr:ABC transporter permease [Candidatus Moduliflexus flocculans]
MTAVSRPPGGGTPNWGIGVEGVETDRPLNMNFMTCDQDFAEVLNIRMAEGRFLSREHPSDVDAVVINGKAKEYFGIPDPVGKKLRIWWTRKDIFIIGVIDDFHFESLHPGRPAHGLRSCRRPSTRPGGPTCWSRSGSARTTEVLSHIEQDLDVVRAGPALRVHLPRRPDRQPLPERQPGRADRLRCSPSWRSSSPAWGCSAWPRTSRSRGPRRSASARSWGPGSCPSSGSTRGQFVKWVVDRQS